MTVPGLVEALIPLVEALERLGVSYYVGGSVASSTYSVGRSTVDADIVADIHLSHVPSLVEQLQDAYYIFEEMIEDAIQRRASFNVIYIQSMFKVDVFIPKLHPFAQEEARRASLRVLRDDTNSHHFYVASPEDIVLRKLEWYKMGDGVSDRQWLDVLGVLKHQAEKLDRAYLQRWAKELGITDLLGRALEDAGL